MIEGVLGKSQRLGDVDAIVVAEILRRTGFEERIRTHDGRNLNVEEDEGQ